MYVCERERELLSHPTLTAQCPFHGRIIARDEQGRPARVSESVAGSSTSEAADGNVGGIAPPALTWEDLSDDVLQMTGVLSKWGNKV